MKVLLSHSPMFARASDLFKSAGHQVITMRDVFSNADLKSVFRTSSYIIRDFAQPDTSDLTEKPANFVDNELTGYMYVRVPDMLRVFSGLDALKPDIVIVHNDVEPMNRMACEWANMRGVKSIHVPHDIHVQDINRGEVGSDIHDIITASHIATSGKPRTEWYLERGAPYNNVVEIGYLPFDTIDIDSNPRGFLGIEDDRPVIVYASSWGQVTNANGGTPEWKDAYKAFLGAVDDKANNVIIKTHPHGNNDDWHIKIAEEMGVRCMVSSSYKDNILAVADTVVAFGGSNILIDASFINKRARLISIGGCFGDCRCVDIVSVDGLKDALLSDGEYHDYPLLSDTYVLYNDGKAAERLVSYAEEIV